MPTVEIEGMKELNRKLARVSDAVDPKIVTKALRKAMKPMLDQARRNAPIGTESHRSYKGRLITPGFLRRNIKLKKLRRRDKTKVVYAIYAQDEAWYGGLIETGYRAGKRNKLVRRAGSEGALSDTALSRLGDRRDKVKARPWLGPAYEQHKDSVARTFKENILKEITEGFRK